VNARRQVAASRVRRELLPEQSKELLKELHLLTRDGRLNADSLRKLKQVNHLVGLLTPALDDVLQRFGAPAIVDVGSGNAYLGFVLYELFLKEKGELLSVESRADLSAKAAQRAKTLGFERMKFETGAIATAAYPERIHLLTALHACDTATDDALARGIKAGSALIVVAPCCQKELRPQLRPAPVLEGVCAARALRAPDAPARVRLAPDQRHPRAGARGARLPGDGHRAHRLGAQPEERAHPRPEDPR
jgi:protein-L-isoaspartate O-methyltransferase